MVEMVLGLILTLLAFHNAQGQKPPAIKDSFLAWGEIVQTLPETNNLIVLQTAFEESYDASTQNAAFLLYLAGKNLTFVKNYDSNQTFLYVETNTTRLRCMETSEKEWIVSDFAPSLLSYEDDDGTVKFSLTQLLNIPDKYMSDRLRGVSTTYRGIPAKSWIYEIKTRDDDNKYDVTLTIQSYWSDGKWNTSSGQVVTPLGFNVSKLTWSDDKSVEDYVINVYGFARDAYDHKYFEPIQGVICQTRKSTLEFPNVKDIKAISLHSELALPDYQELRYIDTWFDPVNQLVRVDVERFKDEDPLQRKEKQYQSEIAIGLMGIVYRFGYYKGVADCKVIPFDKYENDLQNLFDIKQDLKRWKMGKIFGLNDTSYTYIGQTTKNDIPCHLFQGIRKDWPDKASNITSLWEWCFNVNMSKNDVVLFRDGEFGLINANTMILSDPKGIYKNYRMNYHFYEVKAQDPKILDSTSFDIGRCFPGKEKRALQFYLTLRVGDDNRLAIENATSDITFLQRWKDAIYTHSGLQDYSLRLTNVRATIDSDKVYIKFSMINVHKDLPKSIKDKQISTSEAEKNLRDKINDGKVAILYQLQKGKLTTVKAEEHSVSFQLDPKFEPQTMPPLPSTTPVGPTDFVFSLRTEPTTPKNEEVKHEVKYTGNQPGAVAGVSIAMLLAGISIGASGTFYKFNGLPACMRR